MVKLTVILILVKIMVRVVVTLIVVNILAQIVGTFRHSAAHNMLCEMGRDQRRWQVGHSQAHYRKKG